MTHNKDKGTSVGFSSGFIFEIKNKKCSHKYDILKRVNDISIDGEVFRQVNCEFCGKYRYKINLEKFHPALLPEIIFIK